MTRPSRDGDEIVDPVPARRRAAIATLARPIRRAVLQGHLFRRHLAYPTAPATSAGADREAYPATPDYSTSPPLRP